MKAGARMGQSMPAGVAPLRVASSEPRIGHNSRARGVGNAMYAISFDLDTKALRQNYRGGSWQNAYAEIGKFLHESGFDRQQGSVYFGGDEIDVVTCQNAIFKLTLDFDWFAASVRYIRMLRIEDNNDLMSTVRLAESTKSRKI